MAWTFPSDLPDSSVSPVTHQYLPRWCWVHVYVSPSFFTQVLELEGTLVILSAFWVNAPEFEVSRPTGWPHSGKLPSEEAREHRICRHAKGKAQIQWDWCQQRPVAFKPRRSAGSGTQTPGSVQWTCANCEPLRRQRRRVNGKRETQEINSSMTPEVLQVYLPTSFPEGLP